MLIPKNLEDLKRIVEERLEETVRLEFKRQLPPSGKNDDIAQDLCAMANAEGGLLIYGVDQDDVGRAKALNPIPATGAAERVGLVAHSRLDEALALGLTHTIPCEDNEGHGFLVVEVPQSERAPHFFQGTAWGRTSKGNVRLTRRRIGELFAGSTGFAEEFGLAVGRPGRVFAEHELDRYQVSDMYGREETRKQHYLVFKNDGDDDCLDANWEWVTGDPEAKPPRVFDNPFPLDSFQPGVRVPLLVALTHGTPGNLKVVTHWRDKQGNQHQQAWPITW